MKRLHIAFRASGEVALNLVDNTYNATSEHDGDPSTVLPVDIDSPTSLDSALRIALEPIAGHLAQCANIAYDATSIETRTQSMLLDAQTLHRDRADAGDKEAERTWAALTLALTRSQGMNEETERAISILRKRADEGDDRARELLNKFSTAYKK